MWENPVGAGARKAQVDRGRGGDHRTHARARRQTDLKGDLELKLFGYNLMESAFFESETAFWHIS